MANPYTRGTLTTFPNGPAQGTDNLTGLANGNARGLGAVNSVPSNAPDADVVIAPIQIETGASGVSPTGTCSLYLICSEDNTIYDGLISPSSTSDQSALLANLPPERLIETINTTAAATKYVFKWFSLFGVLGNVPTWFAVVVLNQSGATLNATASNFSAKYAADTFN